MGSNAVASCGKKPPKVAEVAQRIRNNRYIRQACDKFPRPKELFFGKARELAEEKIQIPDVLAVLNYGYRYETAIVAFTRISAALLGCRTADAR